MQRSFDGNPPPMYLGELFDKMIDVIGLRKFLHFLCEAEIQMKEQQINIMICFTNILYEEKLINSELRSTLEKPLDQNFRSSLCPDRKYSSFVKKSPQFLHYKNGQIDNYENISFAKREGNENERNETFDRSIIDMKNSPKNNLLQIPASYEKLMSDYSGEISVSFQGKKTISKEEKILNLDEETQCKEFKSEEFIKIDHALSESNIKKDYLKRAAHEKFVLKDKVGVSVENLSLVVIKCPTNETFNLKKKNEK